MSVKSVRGCKQIRGPYTWGVYEGGCCYMVTIHLSYTFFYNQLNYKQLNLILKNISNPVLKNSSIRNFKFRLCKQLRPESIKDSAKQSWKHLITPKIKWFKNILGFSSFFCHNEKTWKFHLENLKQLLSNFRCFNCVNIANVIWNSLFFCRMRGYPSAKRRFINNEKQRKGSGVWLPALL